MRSGFRLVPERDLRDALLRVQMPGRYVGGEVGAVRKQGEGFLDVAISYPDMYEVGMSNLAVKILYRLLNGIPGVRCERVFAAAPDFEAELRAAATPLYSLESGIPLHNFDVIGFSVGYELCLTNLLAILDLGRVPILSAERESDDPIVIAGGPAVTNPVPLGRFADCVFIGEAEGWAERVFAELARAKAGGGGRAELLALLRAEPHVFWGGAERTARRAVWMGFGAGSPPAQARALPPLTPPFPVANIKCVQDEGSVEIMRGCPNGCRFCHAGILYRPFRVKPPEQIVREVEELVFRSGYDEITLASLSSGDYPGIAELVPFLNRRYAPFGVSFSLPSLRVSSMALELMKGLSEVRKSGLTFAVETPLPEGQRSVNKLAPMEKVIELLLEAKGKGWHKAKFYFMVGLPQTMDTDEARSIAEFLHRVRSATGMELHVNVAAFVPKPHTPFQWSRQLGETDALDRINAVRKAVGRGGIRIGYHPPFIAVLEGLLARGDERAAELVERAFRRGARLDAWDEYRQWDLWRAVFAGAGWDVEAEVCRARAPDEALPWEAASLGVTRTYLARERDRAERGEETGACSVACGESCGVCRGELTARDRGWSAESQAELEATLPPTPYRSPPDRVASGEKPARVLFAFSKRGKAAYLSHLNVMTVLGRAFRRAGLAMRFSEGFNPQPRLELANPLALGLESSDEIGSVELYDFPGEAELIARVNAALPEGLELAGARVLAERALHEKRLSLMAAFWGADYAVEPAHAWLLAALGRAGAELVSECRVDGASIRFRLCQSGGSPVGVMKALGTLAGRTLKPQELRIRRVASLRLGPAGEPRGYLEPDAESEDAP